MMLCRYSRPAWKLPPTGMVSKHPRLTSATRARNGSRRHPVRRGTSVPRMPDPSGCTAIAGNSQVRFRVRLDGGPPGPAHGLDIDDDGTGTVTEHRLYQLIRAPGRTTDRLFEVEFLDAGVEAFVFTFG